MKHTLIIFIFALLFFACRKPEQVGNDSYLETVKSSLKDSLSNADFQELDFSRAVLNEVDSADFYLLRIPFIGKHVGSDFVLAQTKENGILERGRIVHLKGKINKTHTGTGQFDGEIRVRSLQGKELVNSAIVNGYISAFHSRAFSRSTLVQPGNVMPEVIVTYVIPSSGGISLSSWFLFQSLFGSGFSGSFYSFFDANNSSLDGGGGYPYGGGSGGGGGGPTNEPPILVDLESQDAHDAIDLQKFINCFNAVPDDGADCSIEIFADIPVDANPNTFFDFNTGSPGHVFINVRKSNGPQVASQNIGFYPKSGYKASTYAPTAGKLVNNEHHEFNASLKMNLSPTQLNSILNKMQQLSNLNYDVDEYNCADWALDIFNHVRANKVAVPLYGIPGSPLTHATRTPQGLYQKLRQMVNANDPEKGNITIGIVKGYAGGSTGPCN